MQFNKLIVQNYKTFRFRTEFDFTINRGNPTQNVFLIGGMNGAGKTSILDAINLCLYGEKKTERIFKAINQSECAHGNYECTIELQFEMDNGDNIFLNRTWNIPYSLQDNPTVEDLKEKIIISKNKKIISEIDKQRFLEYIKSEIPSGITQFFFFDGEKIQEMAADEYAATNLKESMESALGIENIHKLIDDLDKIKKDERRDSSSITNDDIKLKENELEQLKNKLKKQQQELSEKEQQMGDYRTLVEELKTVFQKEFGFNPEDIHQKEQNEKLKLEYTSRLSELDLEIRKSIENYFAFSLLIPIFNKVRAQIKNEMKLNVNLAIKQISDTLPQKIVDEIKSFEDIDRKKPLTQDELQILLERISTVVHKYIPKKGLPEKTVEFLHLSKEDSNKVLLRLDEIEQNFPREFLQLIHERQKILGDVELVEKDLRKKSFEGQKLKRFGDLQHQIELISGNIGEGKGSIEKISSDITSNSDFIKKIEKELDALYLAYEKSSKKAKFLKEIANISNLLNEYIDKLRAAKINQLEDSTFLMFKKLLGKGESINNLSIDPKTYLITIVNNSGHIVRKESLSAGEKEIFAISLLWGLARTSQLKLPIIIDTPLSRLDSHHRDKIVGEYFPSAGHQVIILSTDTEVDKKYYDILENHLQHAIRLKYDGNEKITTLEDGYFWRS